MKKIFLLAFLSQIILSGIYAQNPAEKPDMIFLLAGQSNMDGCGISSELPDKYKDPPVNVRVWDNRENKWVMLGETTFSRNRDLQFGPEMEFSHRLSKAYPDHNIRLIKTSGGGTKLFNQWCPGCSMYKRFAGNIRNALSDLDAGNRKYEICGLLWMQGESDSETVEMASAYEENLRIFLDSVRLEINKPALPVVIGRISSSLLLETPWVFDQTPIVQQAQETVAREDPNVFIVNTDKFSTLPDNTHFDTKGQLKLGRKMARIMIREIENK
jgi:hypothetical protein